VARLRLERDRRHRGERGELQDLVCPRVRTAAEEHHRAESLVTRGDCDLADEIVRRRRGDAGQAVADVPPHGHQLPLAATRLDDGKIDRREDDRDRVVEFARR
jgi:hypothetical protein